MFLPGTGPFDLRATVRSHGPAPRPSWTWRDDPRPVLRRAQRGADGHVRLIEVRPARGGVILRLVGRNADQAEVIAPEAARIRRALRLDEDLRAFHALCRHEPRLRSIARTGVGHLLRGTSLFEDVVHVIAALLAHPSPPSPSLLALCRLGTRCPTAPRFRAFPTPAELAGAGLCTLRDEIGFGRRARGVIAIAAANAHRLDVDALDEGRVARLIARLPGGGRAASDSLLLLLGRYGHPVIDETTIAWARRSGWGGSRPTRASIARAVARYDEW